MHLTGGGIELGGDLVRVDRDEAAFPVVVDRLEEVAEEAVALAWRFRGVGEVRLPPGISTQHVIDRRGRG